MPHNLVLIEDTSTTTSDYGQPIPGPVIETPFKGFLQPRSSRELAQANEAGVAIGTHVVYVTDMRVPLAKEKRIRFDPDDGRRFQIEGDPRDEAGRHHHFAVDLRQVHP